MRGTLKIPCHKILDGRTTAWPFPAAGRAGVLSGSQFLYWHENPRLLSADVTHIRVPRWNFPLCTLPDILGTQSWERGKLDTKVLIAFVALILNGR